MDTTFVTYRLEGSIATIRMDDGKSNALSPRMFGELNAALDRAERDKAIVILTGREGVFSAGFDLNVLKRGGTDTLSMLRSGFELSERVLSFPTPVIAAVSGHALAMGVFLTCSSDYRIGCEGTFKFSVNEVAIGLPVPRWATEVCRHRFSPAYFTRSVLLAETFSPEGALAVGMLDRVVPPAQLLETAQAMASEFSKLDMKSHLATKERARLTLLRDMRALSKTDFRDYVVQGAKMFLDAKLGRGKRGKGAGATRSQGA